MEVVTKKGRRVGSLDLSDPMLKHSDYRPVELAVWNLTGKPVRVACGPVSVVLRPNEFGPVADYWPDQYGVEVGEGESQGIRMYKVEGENTDGFLELNGFFPEAVPVIFKRHPSSVIIPRQHTNRIYLVRWHIAQNVPERDDVFFPYPVLRETEEELVCRGFGTVCPDWEKNPSPVGVPFLVES